MNRQTAFSALAFLSTLLLGCDSANNPLAPSGTVLTITAVPSQIPLSGEGSRVTVIGVKPDGNPINPGTQVTFIASLGVLRPVSGSCADSAVVDVVEADDRGRTSALLCGDGRSGEAMVTATLTSAGGGSGGGEGGGGATGASASVTVQIGETDASRPTLIISANPSIIPVTGCSLISLIARSADGSPVAAGERIRLTADLGTLICPAVTPDACPDEPPSGSCSEVFTDANGEAEVTFLAGDRGGTASVSALLGTSEQVSTMVTLNAALEELTLSASPNEVRRLDTDEVVTLTALVVDPLGIPLRNVLVRFESVYRPGAPDEMSIGRLSATAEASNSEGIAQVTLSVTRTELTPIPEDGSFVVRASATSEGVSRSESATIRVLGSPNP